MLMLHDEHCIFNFCDILGLGSNLGCFFFVFFCVTDAAGNFLCPANSLSFNAFKTVMEIDTMGTFNTSKVVYEKWFQVGCAYLNFFRQLVRWQNY